MPQDQDITDLFSIFHDGTIESITENGSACTFVVSIEYLAEPIDPIFKIFHLTLSNFQDFTFLPWLENHPPISSPPGISGLQLEILGSELRDHRISVSCIQDYHDLQWSGGDLLFSADSFQLSDQVHSPLSLSRTLNDSPPATGRNSESDNIEPSFRSYKSHRFRTLSFLFCPISRRSYIPLNEIHFPHRIFRPPCIRSGQLDRDLHSRRQIHLDPSRPSRPASRRR